MIPAFEREKTFHALDRAATVNGPQIHTAGQMQSEALSNRNVLKG
jgi:hypothetical protein